jgi:NAD(P)-dependent dehydrogenase (short-subunit alcohol dehydrogenase family)
MVAMKNKVVIVTGGSSGIGLAAAQMFAAAGAKVVITGRRESALDAAVTQNPNLAALAADASQPEDVERTIGHAVDKFGRLDVLVNNAGAGAILPLADATAARIGDIFAVNVVGPSLLAAAALPHLKTSRGTIVNVSSTYGHRPIAGLSHYAASKAALEQLTRCWALELAPLGIRVNGVAAGPTESGALTGMMRLTAEQAEAVKAQERERIPLRRRGEPDDVARWILSLADPAASWVTGQVIAVDGGLGLT